MRKRPKRRHVKTVAEPKSGPAERNFFKIVLRTIAEPSFLRVLITAVYLALGSISVAFGTIWADEGWYLLASRAVYSGDIPYRDFLFTQMPLVPYVYGIPLSLFGSSILVGRITSLIFGTAAIWILLSIFKKSRIAVLISGSFLVVNLNFVFDTILIKTQSLTVLLTAGALASFSSGINRQNRAMMFMTLAVLTRLSLLPALVTLWGYVVFSNRSALAKNIGLVVLNATVLLAVAVGLQFLSDGNFLFGVFSFHNDFFPYAAASMESLIRFGVDVLHNQGLLTVSALICGIAALTGLVFPRLQFLNASDRRTVSFSFICWIAITIIHASRKVPYATYQNSIICFAVLCATPVIVAFLQNRAIYIARSFTVFFAAAALLGMGFQDFPVDFQEDAFVRHDEAHLAIDAAEHAGAKTILTFSPELAAESNLSLLPGYEMGLFAYFPHFGTETSVRRRVKNRNLFLRDLDSKAADVVALTGQNIVMMLSNGVPSAYRELFSRIETGYYLRTKIRKYGQFHDTLFIFVKR